MFTIMRTPHGQSNGGDRLGPGVEVAYHASPVKSGRPGFGRHTFRVKAMDAAGNETAPPAAFTFRIVRRP